MDLPPDPERRTLIHDLNNSLASITAFAHLLRTDPLLADELRRDADLLSAETDRLRALVARLLELDRPSPSQPAQAAEPAGPDRPARPRILVVDDEPSIRRFLGKALEAAGFEPELAADGPTALAQVERLPIAVVLCDHRLGGMSGQEVYTAAIALRPALRRRFALLSGDATDPELRAFTQANDLALVAKPFQLEAIQQTVRELLARED